MAFDVSGDDFQRTTRYLPLIFLSRLLIIEFARLACYSKKKMRECNILMATMLFKNVIYKLNSVSVY